MPGVCEPTEIRPALLRSGSEIATVLPDRAPKGVKAKIEAIVGTRCSPMTVADRITKWLRDNRGYAYCDGCIAMTLKLSRPQQAQAVTTALATASKRFCRFRGDCHRCFKEKLVTMAKGLN
jgi:hypothetical protein